MDSYEAFKKRKDEYFARRDKHLQALRDDAAKQIKALRQNTPQKPQKKPQPLDDMGNPISPPKETAPKRRGCNCGG
jgi:hypothetical protein